ncbi:MAG: LuxR C-terminal-related transcriptional regulator [Candidatus Cyclobacteriaceae bacterium M3_2C_046]
MLLTKFHIPVPNQNLVYRNHLFHLLNEGFHRKLILISAPAGYGKSTLLSSWIHKNQISAAWYSAGSRDNDPKDFITLIINAIQLKYQEAGIISLETLNSPQDANPDYVLDLLINDLLQIEEHVFLIIDDFHLIATTEVCRLVTYLLDHLPLHIHLTLATRSDPPVSLARLRSQQQLVEIRAANLSFTGSDINYFFDKKLNMHLSENDIDLLRKKTEGWIAGIQLTALSLQDKEDVSGYLLKLAGDNRYIMDYMLEEVLAMQSEKVHEFLLKTSSLDQFCGSLCDYVLGKSDSQSVIEKLEKENMFLVPLDDSRRWFRYHHLFSDLLQMRLKVHFQDQLLAVHQKASEWFEQNNMLNEAIDHALLAHSFQRALDLLDMVLDDYWLNGKTGEIVRFGQLIPQDQLRKNKRVTVYYGWALVILGETDKALLVLEGLEKIADDDPEISGKLYITYNLLFTFTGDTRRAFHYSDLALQNLSRSDLNWNVWAFLSHGEACHCTLDVNQALSSWHQALAISQQLNNHFLIILCYIELGYSFLLKGRLRDTYQLCLEQIQALKSLPPAKEKSMEIFSSMFYCMAGYVLAEWNEPEKAIELGETGYRLSRKTSNISFIGYCDWLLACTYMKLLDFEKAASLLAEIEHDPRMTQLLTGLGYSLSVKIQLLKQQPKQAALLLKKEKQRTDIINEYETVAVKTVLARHYVDDYHPDKALTILHDLQLLTQEKDVKEMLLEILLLSARACFKKHETEKSNELLQQALSIGQNEEFISTFIHEGEDMEQMLKSFTGQNKNKAIASSYLNKLLAAFGEIKNENNSPLDLLSQRELDTLQLIAQGMTNQDVADQLFISLNTVKTHLKNIYLKLEINKRTDAVSKARQLGLL